MRPANRCNRPERCPQIRRRDGRHDQVGVLGGPSGVRCDPHRVGNRDSGQMPAVDPRACQLVGAGSVARPEPHVGTRLANEQGKGRPHSPRAQNRDSSHQSPPARPGLTAGTSLVTRGAIGAEPSGSLRTPLATHYTPGCTAWQLAATLILLRESGALSSSSHASPASAENPGSRVRWVKSYDEGRSGCLIRLRSPVSSAGRAHVDRLALRGIGSTELSSDLIRGLEFREGAGRRSRLGTTRPMRAGAWSAAPGPVVVPIDPRSRRRRLVKLAFSRALGLLENFMAIGLEPRTIEMGAHNVLRNPPPALLYEHAVAREGAVILANGALATYSGEKTGRSPQDKRIVENPESAGRVWWGSVNIPASDDAFLACRRQAVEFLEPRPTVYVVDGYAGWDAAYRIKVRVICARAYHALFMHNLLIRPSRPELEYFGEPDFVIFNAGDQAADRRIPGVSSGTSVMLDLERREMVILGTNYAGEMKKGVFTAMNYWMPEDGVLSMHCSANEGPSGDTTLFFGLSGTGKTTLSSDPRRPLIGDDEHCWSDRGIFNIEGGCYAKCLGLSEEHEPQIYRAIRFGSVLENVVFDPESRVPDYKIASLTENTRACYPIEHIPGALVPCVGAHPDNIIFLTCDAFGVLPPVSRLTTNQAMYHFLSGYTAKVAGTEVGVVEPQATFSACFGAAFLVLHPARYAELLAEKMRGAPHEMLAGQHRLDRRTVWSGFTDQAGAHPRDHRRHPRRRALAGAGHARTALEPGDPVVVPRRAA